MRIRRDAQGLDAIDRAILEILQRDCKTPLAKIGEQVDLSPPSILERVHKLEAEVFIRGYQAMVDARRLGIDVTAFIGVSIGHPAAIGRFEGQLAALDDVLECHHVTGEHTLLLKVKTRNTQSLEALIRALREIDGVERTQTSVVLSTKVERSNLGHSAFAVEGSRAKRGRTHAVTARRAS